MTGPADLVHPTAIIGDVHGRVDRLSAAIGDVGDRRCILVGDYINKGPDSRAVLDFLVSEKAQRGDNLVLLRGNHDHLLLEVFQGRSDLSDLVRHGGLPTIKSYVGIPEPDVLRQFKRLFPVSHLNLLASTNLFFEEDGLFVSHAGWNPKDPESRTPKDLILGGQPDVFDPACPPPQQLAVFGHYQQWDGEPFCTADRICLDTGCGSDPDRPLTVLRLPERDFRQF